MAAYIGVQNLNGITAPLVGATQNAQYEDTVGIVKERNEDGDTAFLVPQKFFRREARADGVGDAELAAALADVGVKAKAALGIIRAKQDEFQNALPRWEIVGVSLHDVV